MKHVYTAFVAVLLAVSFPVFAQSEMSKLTDKQCEELADVTHDVVAEFNRAKTVEDVQASYEMLKVKYENYPWFNNIVMFALQPPKLSAQDSHDSVLNTCLESVKNGTVSI